MTISLFENCSIHNRDCFANTIEFCTDTEVEIVLSLTKNLHSLSEKVYSLKCKTTSVMIVSQINHPQLSRYKNLEQVRLAKQTHTLITKHCHFSNEKKYHCLRALSASLATNLNDEEDENEATTFRAISLANIPHFILTRCWEINVDWECDNYSDRSIGPITKRALSALIQSYKNVALTSILNFPNYLLTKGNNPIWVKSEVPCMLSAKFKTDLPKFAPTLSGMKCTNLREISKSEKVNYYRAAITEVSTKRQKIEDGLEKEPVYKL